MIKQSLQPIMFDTEFVKKLQESPGIMYWRLAILKCAIKTFITGLGVFLAGLAGINNWGELSPVQFFCLLGSSSIASAGVVDAFLDETRSQLKADHPDNPKNQPPNTITQKIEVTENITKPIVSTEKPII